MGASEIISLLGGIALFLFGMALMLVNHNDLNTGNAAEVILTFSGAQSVTARIGTETTVLTPAADGTYALTLSAGQGCFLEVTF